MRVPDDLRKCVVFIGFADPQEPSGIKCVGTAFLIVYKQNRYLVTVQHIAASIRDGPFKIRLNSHDGTAGNISVDPLMDGLRWYGDTTDANVDLAIMPFNYGLRESGFDALLIPEQLFANDKKALEENIGIGDCCYTIGLFRLLAGQRRNLPVVHTGNIALMPSDEKIPTRDWLSGDPRKTRWVTGYLVETQAIQGLSGSPVFVRPTMDLGELPVSDKEKLTARLGRADLFLLGVWQSSWDAPPDEVMAIERGAPLRVPVGMGVVVPTERIIHILESEELRALRKEREVASAAASLDSVMPSRLAPPTTEGDEQHKERFTALLGAAVKKRPPTDQT